MSWLWEWLLEAMACPQGLGSPWLRQASSRLLLRPCPLGRCLVVPWSLCHARWVVGQLLRWEHWQGPSHSIAPRPSSLPGIAWVPLLSRLEAHGEAFLRLLTWPLPQVGSGVSVHQHTQVSSLQCFCYF